MNQFNHQRGKHIEIDDAKIYVEEIGDYSKEPLLFLHGGFGNMEVFNEIVSMLTQDFRVIGIDARGQGKSTLGSATLTYERLQKDIEFILDKFHITSLSIIGFSDGGTVALRLACFTTLKINKLVAVGTSWHSKSLLTTKRFLSGITAEKWKLKFPETVEKYQAINPQPDFEKLTKSIVALWIDEKETGHPDDHIKSITCPTLIMRGDKDHLISKKSAFEASELIENANLANIPFCGHEVYVDQKYIFMEMVKEFLKL